MARVSDPAKRDLWRRRLAAFDRGGASVAEFCRDAGVSVASFYQWRRKLELSTAGPTLRTSGEKSAAGTPRPVPAMSFVPIEVTGRSSIEVHLPNGTRVIVPCHDRKVIRTVIATVASQWRENPSC